MRIFKLGVLATLVALSFFGTARAQGEAAVPFLLIAPDSRAGGMGETGTGLADNSSAVFWNPAGAAFLTGQELSFTHSNWLPQFNLDLFYDYATYRAYFEELDGNIMANVTYMNYGEFQRTLETGPEPVATFRSYDMAVTAGYATKLSEDWGVGTNFRLIHSRLADEPTGEEQGSGVATSVAFDLAAMWRPDSLVLPLIGDVSNRLSVGANLSNLGPKIFYIDQDQADPIPTNFRLGFAAQVFADDFNSLTLTLDFSKLLVSREPAVIDSVTNETIEDGSVAPFYEAIFTAWADDPLDQELADVVSTVGMEYWYGEPGDFLFSLRSGFFYEDPNHGGRKFITLGGGIRYDLYGVDFSYISTAPFKDAENHPLNETLRFTILVGWGGVIEGLNGFPRGM
ncbi:MAG: type IX secretion system outer membrane channel protein PorV [Ignavibacteriales bacterium]|nr:type IX secretion system outer membrane channel protein PorV [Ignavibacteriales bacterium]